MRSLAPAPFPAAPPTSDRPGTVVAELRSAPPTTVRADACIPSSAPLSLRRPSPNTAPVACRRRAAVDLASATRTCLQAAVMVGVAGAIGAQTTPWYQLSHHRDATRALIAACVRTSGTCAHAATRRITGACGNPVVCGGSLARLKSGGVESLPHSGCPADQWRASAGGDGRGGYWRWCSRSCALSHLCVAVTAYTPSMFARPTSGRCRRPRSA